MKAWSQRLVDHVAHWSARHRPDWVPKFVYHFSDINNVASILETGSLYCRNLAEETSAMVVDQACASVIANTTADHCDFVRLYFRPKTPTQYSNEGIRPAEVVEQASVKAHCPVPVFLCFDFVETIQMDGVQVSDGSMARGRVLYSDSEEFFAALPFNLIYHKSWFQPHERDEIIYRRHAEVLVPRELQLNHKLRMIVCRSDAERRTLLHLLKPTSRRRWEPKVRIGYGQLFEANWWHVTNVHAEGKRVFVQLNTGSKPIPITYERHTLREKKLIASLEKTLSAGETKWQVNANSLVNSIVTIRLGGHLAFQAHVSGADQAF